MKRLLVLVGLSVIFLSGCFWDRENEDTFEPSGVEAPQLTETPTSTDELNSLFTANNLFSPEFPCHSLSTTVGRIVHVDTPEQLTAAVLNANESGNTTILLSDGVYRISNGYWIEGNNVIIRSASGNRDAVILEGQGMAQGSSHVFWIAGDNVTIADMTLGWVSAHPIQIHGEHDADNTLIHNVNIVDGGQQLLKISNDESKKYSSDHGVIQCSQFEYSNGVGPSYYIGGVDGHYAKNWTVRNNIFSGIRSPDTDVAEHAIHFWSGSEGTTVEHNVILNSDRGIGFGLGDQPHFGGIIRSNTIYHTGDRGDVGIGLENAQGAVVEHNTILYEHSYPNAIEYRFSGTKDVIIRNNTTNRAIAARDSGTALVVGNMLRED